jgi:hypothetical protein
MLYRILRLDQVLDRTGLSAPEPAAAELSLLLRSTQRVWPSVSLTLAVASKLGVAPSSGSTKQRLVLERPTIQMSKNSNLRCG